MATNYQTTGWQRLLKTAESADTTPPSAVQVAEPVNFVPTLGHPAIRLRFLGDTDGDQYTVDIFAVDVDGPTDRGTRKGYHSTLLGVVSLTIGSQAGVAGMEAGPEDLFADTIVSWSEDAFATDLLAYVGGSVRDHSPTGNAIAELLISDMSNLYGLSFVFDDLAGETANLLYKLDSP